MNEADSYLCVGVCIADPDSGYCLGCGRPPLDSPADSIVAEVVPTVLSETLPPTNDPDSPA